MIKIRVFISGTEKIIENKNIDNFTDFILALLHTKRATTEKLDLTNTKDDKKKKKKAYKFMKDTIAKMKQVIK